MFQFTELFDLIGFVICALLIHVINLTQLQYCLSYMYKILINSYFVSYYNLILTNLKSLSRKQKVGCWTKYKYTESKLVVVERCIIYYTYFLKINTLNIITLLHFRKIIFK